MRSLRPTLLLVAALALVLGSSGLAPATAQADPAPREDDVVLTMSDGVRLLADRWVPREDCPCPVVVVMNPYGSNSEGVAATGGGGPRPQTFLDAGYAVVLVDVRGTGQSEGVLGIFSPREQQDLREVVDLLAVEDFSSGDVVMFGGSYRGISGLLAAAQQPPALRAVFSLVPFGDPYRDILSSGGSADNLFLATWGLGLVTGPATVQNLLTAQHSPDITLNAASQRLTSLTDVTTALVAINTGEDQGAVPRSDDPQRASAATPFDSDFYRIRSPLLQADRIDVPTYLVAGTLDIFQRSQPLLHDAIDLPDGQLKLLVNRGYHLDAQSQEDRRTTSGEVLPTMEELAVEWFDRWVRGLDNGVEDRPAVQRYYHGADVHVDQVQDPPASVTHERWFLDAAQDAVGVERPTTTGAAALPFSPVQNVCSGMTVQYLFGAVPQNRCSTERPVEEPLTTVLRSAPVTEPTVLSGPASLRVQLEVDRPDTNLVAVLGVEHADGTVTDYSHGAVVGSLLAVDPTPCGDRPVYGCSVVTDDGDLVQPWHPFTEESVEKLEPGRVYDGWVELLPLSVELQPGERVVLRLATADFPHTATPTSVLRDAVGSVTTIHTGPTTDSYLVLPVVHGGVATLDAEYAAATAAAPASDDAGAADAPGPTAPAGQAPTQLPATGAGGAVPALVALLLAAALRRRSD